MRKHRWQKFVNYRKILLVLCSNFHGVSQPECRAVDNLVDGFNGKKMGIHGEISKLLVENIDVMAIQCAQC